jgi:hypothetical protein
MGSLPHLHSPVLKEKPSKANAKAMHASVPNTVNAQVRAHPLADQSSFMPINCLRCPDPLIEEKS